MNATVASPDEYDPRRDIHMTGVTTEMTSGSSLMRRVLSDRALYSETRGVIQLDEAHIETFNPDGALQGVTVTDKAMIFLADQPPPTVSTDQPTSVTTIASSASTARKGNMEFVGSFRHRSPAKDDPTTDAMSLSTDQLIWDNEKKLFVCPRRYRMISTASGKPPMVLKGKQFIATEDLQSFTMGGGSFTSDINLDAHQVLTPLGREIQDAAAALADRYKPMPSPPPLEIPQSAEGFPTQNLVEQALQIKKAAPAQ